MKETWWTVAYVRDGKKRAMTLVADTAEKAYGLTAECYRAPAREQCLVLEGRWVQVDLFVEEADGWRVKTLDEIGGKS